MKFDDPALLQALGRLSISFTLLEADLCELTPLFTGSPPAGDPFAGTFSNKAKTFIKTARAELRRVAPQRTEMTDNDLLRLRSDLTDVQQQRNRYIHDYWTIEWATQRFKVLRKKQKPAKDLYPSPKDLNALADQAHALRANLCHAINTFARHSQGMASGPTSQRP
jgi:hypothetical protein